MMNLNEIDKYTPAYEPVTLREPTKLEKKLDLNFTSYLSKEIEIESDEEMARRDVVLAQVRDIFNSWVKFIAIKIMHMSEEDAEEYSGTMFISGSHRLGVRDIGADIDTVCVAPSFCTR